MNLKLHHLDLLMTIFQRLHERDKKKMKPNFSYLTPVSF